MEMVGQEYVEINNFVDLADRSTRVDSHESCQIPGIVTVEIFKHAGLLDRYKQMIQTLV